MTKQKVELKTKKRARASRHHRRVCIFGAGMSASCGIAVAKDILREAVVRLSRRDSERAERIHKLLRYLYPGFQNLVLNYPNIEDFLNLLQMAKLFNTEDFIESSLWSETKIQDVERITLKAVTDYIWEQMQQNQGMEVIKQFIMEWVRAGDTFITFNWDLSLERALEDNAKNPSFWYSYPPNSSDDESVTVLKPHGSVDWYRKTDLPQKRLKGRVQTLDESVSVFTRFDFSEIPEMANCTPVIVPPVAAKDFSHDILKRTWQGVYRAVSRATNLYIFGYSLPKEDQFARLVLGRALRSNSLKSGKKEKLPLRVVVVNPDETAETTFRRLLGPNVSSFVFYQATFQNYWAGIRE